LLNLTGYRIWAHDITNVGTDEMVVMLWANENFDRQRPDTVPSKV